MNKYDVNLIVDKEGKPMPQYYDEVEGVMKPITRNNFDGSVQVGNFPDIQKVEVTNQKDVQDVNVTNPVNSVEISNFPLTQDVNVINPQKNVTIDNFPSVQNVTDAQVKAELEQIKATQAQILKRLNGQLVTEDGAQVVVDETHLVKETRLATNIEILPGETFSKFITIDVPIVSGYVTATETSTATSWELEFAYRAGYYAQGFRSEEKKSSDATIGTQFPRLQELKRHNAPTRVFNYIVRNNTESTIQVTPVFLEWRL